MRRGTEADRTTPLFGRRGVVEEEGGGVSRSGPGAEEEGGGVSERCAVHCRREHCKLLTVRTRSSGPGSETGI